MSILSRLFKKYVSPAQHFGIHAGLNGHLVDSADTGPNTGGGW
ncbi:hypothetical protein AE04_02829 [Klebsiella aerogenes MGH 78]|uniref:Uncharacterized protein n=1 Tax=Citrobacter amalonaticus TaxID=35703 RepID=A0A6N2WYK3_CITAM|nr:hypothetical protein [Klebsiella michiganensis]KDF30708.1 hypothetical protein AE04_02829 [Klebsiella aerogenes MGH 78]